MIMLYGSAGLQYLLPCTQNIKLAHAPVAAIHLDSAVMLAWYQGLWLARSACVSKSITTSTVTQTTAGNKDISTETKTQLNSGSAACALA